MHDQLDVILNSLRNSWFFVGEYLPRLIAAMLVLTVGWLLARGARWLLERFFRLIHADTAAERTGIETFLLRGGVRFTAVTLLGQAIYWGVLLIFVIAALNLLGLTVGPDTVDRMAGYVPNVAAALVVLVIGSLCVKLIRGLAEAYLNNIGVKSTANIGLLLQSALLIFVGILALEQLGLSLSLLSTAFQLAFGGLCLGLALAFGLGGRAWAEAILERARNSR
jgi:hypothetical protein